MITWKSLGMSYFIVAHFLFLSSCNSYQPIKNSNKEPEYCTDFKDFLQKNWLQHKKSNIYNCTDRTAFEKEVITAYESCISKLTLEEIKNLLGNPSHVKSYKTDNNDLVLYYWLSLECTQGKLGTRTHSESDKICDYVMVQLHKDKVIAGPAFLASEVYPSLK